MSRSSDNLEREIKFPGVELDKLRDRLIELEAERKGPTAFEDNWILDRDNELVKDGKILRLRTDGGRARLTYKGPMRLEGNLKIREEHEIEVENAEQATALLRNLGYSVVRRYQKMREEWQLGGVTIALDHTPIGDFAEFEGDRAEVVAKRCGFDTEKAERRSYLRLYEDYLKLHPDAPPEMVFAERAERAAAERAER
jgi:predicted adenylyl cyclase CyaB